MAAIHRIQRGLALMIDGRHYEVDRLLEKNTVVQLEDVITGARIGYPIARLHRRVNAGEIRVLGEPLGGGQLSETLTDSEPLPVLLGRLTSSQELALNRRRGYVQAMRRRGLSSGMVRKIEQAIPQAAAALGDSRPPSACTVRRWLLLYENGGRSYGALIPRTFGRKRPSRISSADSALAWACLKKHYFTKGGPGLKETYGRFVQEHRRLTQGIPGGEAPAALMSLSSFRRLAWSVSAYERDRIRIGPTFAAHKWRHSVGGTYATRPMERVEMDHTVLDIYVIDDEWSIPPGRPTLTLLIDSFSNYILALYISFEGESLGRLTTSIKMALGPKEEITQAAETKNEWPTPGMWECLVVDNALACKSDQVQRITNVLGCAYELGAVRKPWFKPTVERYMREVARLLPAEGKTGRVSRVKEATDPYKEACISFSDLSRALVKWAVDVHPFEIPERTLARPIDRLRDGLLRDPAPVVVQDLDQLSFITAMEKAHSVGPGGVEFQLLTYRSVGLGELAKRQRFPTFKTLIRYDQNDLGFIWVRDPTHGTWEKVPCLQFEYAYGLTCYQHKQIRRFKKANLKRNGAVEYLLQAKEDLRDELVAGVNRGKKALKDRRRLAIMKGVSSLQARQVSATVDKPKEASGRLAEESSIVPADIPSFEAFDLLSRDGWEMRK